MRDITGQLAGVMRDLEEGLNVVKKGALLLDRVATVLADVDEEEDARVQMRKRGNCLHLDSIPLLEWVVQDARCVDHLRDSINIFIFGAVVSSEAKTNVAYNPLKA